MSDLRQIEVNERIIKCLRVIDAELKRLSQELAALRCKDAAAQVGERDTADDLADRLWQEADNITCYGSTTSEYPPNRTAILLREAASRMRGVAMSERDSKTEASAI
jgi:hypothetical protein